MANDVKIELQPDALSEESLKRYQNKLELAKKDILSLAGKTSLAGAPASYKNPQNYEWEKGGLKYNGPGTPFII